MSSVVDKLKRLLTGYAKINNLWYSKKDSEVHMRATQGENEMLNDIEKIVNEAGKE